jgi:cytochrome b involved in lipid metabolism
VTQFAHEHPGGQAVILQQAGGDATDTFDAVHSREILEKYKAQL